MLKIGHLNVRSLASRFLEFKDILLENNFDIFGISETWINVTDNSENFYVPEYTLLRNDRNSRGGGVGIYIKTYLLKYVTSFNNDMNTISPSLEQLWLTLKINNKLFLFGTLYRPPAANINEFFDSLENSLSNSFPFVNYIICFGDININLFNYTNNSVQLFNSLIEQFSLAQVVSEPTRVTNYSETLIDVILTSDTELCSDVQNVNVHDLSDHMLIHFKLNINSSVNKHKIVSLRDFKHVNYPEFLNTLNTIDWRYFYNCSDINEKLAIFNANILSVFDMHMPLKNIIIRKSRTPWITDVIKIMMKFRDNAHADYRRTRNQAHWDYYKSLRNLVTKSIRLEKKAYIEHKINQNPSNLWDAFKEFNICPKNEININHIVSDVDNLNAHFLGSQNVSLPDPDTLSMYNNNLYNPNADKLSIRTVEEDEILKIFLSLHSNAMGNDSINLKMLKMVIPVLLPQLTHLINSCILSSTFPDAWKVAIIKPIPKCNNPSNYNDLRPISILPTLSKILEKLMNNQISNYIKKYNILPDIQSGFRAGFSTTTALTKITDDIFLSLDNKKAVLLVLLDFSRAFDTVSHELLIAKLKFLGFDDACLNLIGSYFSNRCQRIINGENTSEYLTILKGVAQGSICAPLFFSLYTFDLQNCVSACNIHIYADDTQIYYSFDPDNYGQALVTVNSELEKISTYAKNNCLILNESKSAAMLFGSRKIRYLLLNNNLISLNINNAPLHVKQVQKNLGLIIDAELRFSEYVSLLIKKSFLALKNLFMNRFIISRKYKSILADSLVLSIFNYCDTIYGPCLSVRDTKRIQRVQNVCARYVFGLKKFQSVTSLIPTLGWLDMHQRRVHHFACLVHRIISSNTPSYLLNKISYRTRLHNRNLRNTADLHIPSHRTSLFQRSFSYYCPFILNKIPSELKLLSSKLFPKQYKNYLMSNIH